jgi:hypothetical protein
VRHIDALIAYYTPYDPDKLTDDQWAKKWQELVWARKEEAKHNKGQ